MVYLLPIESERVGVISIDQPMGFIAMLVDILKSMVTVEIPLEAVRSNK
jgi:hypothetical protein